MDQLVATHWWVMPLYLFVWSFVRLLKDDHAVRWFPLRLAPKYRVWAALGIGLIGAGIDWIASTNPWLQAFLGGSAASCAAVTTQALILSITGGRELGEAV